jgi:hypothetical protein
MKYVFRMSVFTFSKAPPPLLIITVNFEKIERNICCPQPIPIFNCYRYQMSAQKDGSNLYNLFYSQNF